MSNNPNDPFNNPNAAHNPNAVGHTQGQVEYAQPPQKKRGSGLLIGCGIASLVGLLVCCGGVGVLTYFGLDVFNQMVQAEVENSPQVMEHIGTVESMSLNMSASSEAQAAEPGQRAPMIFDIQGSKGSGQISALQSQTTGGVESAELILSDGTRIPIELSSGDSDFEEIEMELDDLIESGTAEE